MPPGRAGRPRQGRAPARAALAGNPSDGYGGAVLALTLDMLTARVRILPGRAPAGADGAGPELRRQRVTDAGGELTRATLARFEAEFGIPTAGHGVRMLTAIPRSVGLGGSSAIVIATLRALMELHGVTLEPLALAELALSIERDDLGIAAGLQDRLVQARGGLCFMDFSGAVARAEALPYANLPCLLIAWRSDSAAASGVVHGGLRERWEAGDPAVRAGMAELADLAHRARAAVLGADHDAFRAALDGTFDVRARLLELDPAHVEMVLAGRAAGAAVNYTGSGGAVVCACNDSGHRDAVARAMSELGAETVAV